MNILFHDPETGRMILVDESRPGFESRRARLSALGYTANEVAVDSKTGELALVPMTVDQTKVETVAVRVAVGFERKPGYDDYTPIELTVAAVEAPARG